MLCHTKARSHSGPPCAIETAAATCAKPMKMSRSMGPSVNWCSPALSPPGRRCASLSPRTSYATAVRYLSTLSTSGALLAACVAAVSAASASALNAWTSRSVIAHLRMACPHDLLHAPHFPGCKPDLDTARVEGGFREDVFHDAAGKFPGPLVVLLRNVHSQPWLDVFAVLTVHALMSFTLRRQRRCRPCCTHTYRGARVAMCSGVTVMSTRGSVFQRATYASTSSAAL